jgi:hypothetical protein
MAQDALVTDQFGVSLAHLLVNGGPIYLAVGEGLSAWDSADVTPQPTFDQTTLHNELARVDATVEYLDDSGAVSVSPTRTIQCTAEYAVGVANGTLREMGLFVSGSATADSGYMVAAANFPAVSKAAGAEDYILTRKMRLTLQG